MRSAKKKQDDGTWMNTNSIVNCNIRKGIMQYETFHYFAENQWENNKGFIIPRLMKRCAETGIVL